MSFCDGAGTLRRCRRRCGMMLATAAGDAAKKPLVDGFGHAAECSPQAERSMASFHWGIAGTHEPLYWMLQALNTSLYALPARREKFAGSAAAVWCWYHACTQVCLAEMCKLLLICICFQALLTHLDSGCSLQCLCTVCPTVKGNQQRQSASRHITHWHVCATADRFPNQSSNTRHDMELEWGSYELPEHSSHLGAPTHRTQVVSAQLRAGHGAIGRY